MSGEMTDLSSLAPLLPPMPAASSWLLLPHPFCATLPIHRPLPRLIATASAPWTQCTSERERGVLIGVWWCVLPLVRAMSSEIPKQQIEAALQHARANPRWKNYVDNAAPAPAPSKVLPPPPSLHPSLRSPPSRMCSLYVSTHRAPRTAASCSAVCWAASRYART
jgi:hypothetical protein